jgi:DNA-binding GntR family transcriptional regulator
VREGISRSTLAEQVYQQLKRRIINQELRPGSRLIVGHIAEEMGISLTPVREALTRLVKDGLVDMIPHKGAYVAKPTKKNFEDLFAVRQALETLAVRLATPKLTRADFKAMDEILEYGEKSLSAGDSKSWLEADEKLHDFIIRKSENEVLIQIFSQIWDRIHIFRVWTVRYPDRMKRASSEHRNIVSALKERDAQGAEKLMMEHIENTFLAGIENESEKKQGGIDGTG